MLKFTKTSRKKELEGTVVHFDDGMGNTLPLLIARSSGNPHYDATLTKLMAPYKKKIAAGKDIGLSTAKEIITKVLAKDILLGWDETVLLEDDKPVPYSEQKALELLTADNDLRDFVIEQSEDQSNFLVSKK